MRVLTSGDNEVDDNRSLQIIFHNDEKIEEHGHGKRKTEFPSVRDDYFLADAESACIFCRKCSL